MFSRFPTYLVAALSLSFMGVNAGPGANIIACISSPEDDSKSAIPPPFDVTFDISEAGGCMNHVGHGATMHVSNSSGLTCTDIGYVEAKTSGWCRMGSSVWGLGYEAHNHAGHFGGNMTSHWITEQAYVGAGGRGKGRMNAMQVRYAKDAVACVEEKVCEQVKVQGERGVAWHAGTQGPIYVIFTGNHA